MAEKRVITAEFLDIADDLENDTDEQPLETEKPRDINKLLNLSYSEMTDEEIETVIEYKVSQQVESQEYRERMEIAQSESDQAVEVLKAKAEADTAFLQQLTQHAISRFEDVTNG